MNRPEKLPGGGGAPEIATNAIEVFITMKHSKRSFVKDVETKELVVTSLHPNVTREQVIEATGWEIQSQKN